MEHFGELVGRQLVSGGQVVDKELVSRVQGGAVQRLRRVADPPRRPRRHAGRAQAQESRAEAEASALFESGVLKGVHRCRAFRPVGVELTRTEPSQIPWYKSQRISSVDDLDQMAGQAALAYALAGAKGAFGVKSTADSLLPTVNSTASAP